MLLSEINAGFHLQPFLDGYPLGCTTLEELVAHDVVEVFTHFQSYRTFTIKSRDELQDIIEQYDLDFDLPQMHAELATLEEEVYRQIFDIQQLTGFSKETVICLNKLGYTNLYGIVQQSAGAFFMSLKRKKISSSLEIAVTAMQEIQTLMRRYGLQRKMTPVMIEEHQSTL